MKRAEIEVGEVYGVRTYQFANDEWARRFLVPARVVALDAPVEWVVPLYDHKQTISNGGIAVEFIEPTRVSTRGFSLAKGTNEHAGPVVKRFVFHDKRPGCGGSVGRCFAGRWADLEAARKEAERAEREQSREQKRRAAAFRPALDVYAARLAKVGLPVKVHGDGSGLHGSGLSIDLYAGEHGPTGLGYHVELPRKIFDQLVEIAERHGEKVSVPR